MSSKSIIQVKADQHKTIQFCDELYSTLLINSPLGRNNSNKGTNSESMNTFEERNDYLQKNLLAKDTLQDSILKRFSTKSREVMRYVYVVHCMCLKDR